MFRGGMQVRSHTQVIVLANTRLLLNQDFGQMFRQVQGGLSLKLTEKYTSDAFVALQREVLHPLTIVGSCFCKFCIGGTKSSMCFSRYTVELSLAGAGTILFQEVVFKSVSSTFRLFGLASQM